MTAPVLILAPHPAFIAGDIPRLPAEPAPILGKSLRQQREEREAAERAAKPSGPPPMTSAPAGYEVTPQGGLRRKDQPWVEPETKGRALKAEQGNAQPLTDAEAQAMLDNGELPPVQRDDGPCGVVPSFVDLMVAYRDAVARGAYKPWDLMYAATPTGAWVSIPADRRADVIKALNELGS